MRNRYMLRIILGFFGLITVGLLQPEKSFADSVMTVSGATDLGNYTTRYDGLSIYNNTPPATQHIRVVTPNNPAAVPRKIIYILPVLAGDSDGTFGDGLTTLLSINAANALNAYIISPTFAYAPWYGDHVSYLSVRYDSYMVDLYNWASSNLPPASEHIVAGFSKSGWGALSLITRHPTLFTKAICQDFPNPTSVYYGNTAQIFGTPMQGGNTNYLGNYELTQSTLYARALPFMDSMRLWIGSGANFSSDGTYYEGVPTVEGRLTAAAMLHTFSQNGLPHNWTSGWLTVGLNSLFGTSLSTSKLTQVPVAADSFSGGDGDPGANWGSAAAYRSAVAYGHLEPPAGYHAALDYWAGAGTFTDDQWVSAKLQIGSGIALRIVPASASCYFMKTNSTTISLMKMTGATTWSTVLTQGGLTIANGDAWTMTIQTIYGVPSKKDVIRIYQNGTLRKTYSTATIFNSGGVPGVWMYTGNYYLDDWSAGNLTF